MNILNCKIPRLNSKVKNRVRSQVKVKRSNNDEDNFTRDILWENDAI